MDNCTLTIPSLSRCGLFDFKLKFGSALSSPPRVAGAFEIELPVEAGGVSHVAGCAYPILPNQILCVKPGQLRHTVAPFRCCYIHVEPDGGEICRILSSLPDAIPVQHAQSYIDLFCKLAAVKNADAPDKAFWEACHFLNLLQLLRADADGKKTEPPANSRVNAKAVQDAILWIDAHLSERLTLPQIAKAVFLSPIYFRNLFTELAGVSPHVFIQNRRIERAKLLLRSTGKPLSEIAAECGFSSQSYFGSVFKASTGHTPNAYRIMINNQYP